VFPRVNGCSVVYYDVFFWRLCHDSCWSATRKKEDLSERHAAAKELYRDLVGEEAGPDKVLVRNDQVAEMHLTTSGLSMDLRQYWDRRIE